MHNSNRTRWSVAAATAALALTMTACTSSSEHAASRPARTASTAAISSEAVTPAPVSPANKPATARPAVHPVAATNPCAPNHRGRQVRVNLRAQHLWLCQGTRATFDSAITSGVPRHDTSTPTGNFHIQGLNRNSMLTLNTGQTYDVKYWIPFKAPLFGFHDSPWQKFPYGSAQYKKDGSHGCVHLPLASIKRLYAWAQLGTRVHIA